jgi:hypothetical protein
MSKYVLILSHVRNPEKGGVIQFADLYSLKVYLNTFFDACLSQVDKAFEQSAQGMESPRITVMTSECFQAINESHGDN